MNYEEQIARAGLEINAIKLRPDDPFTWASGFRMPIYNDNRMFLFNPQLRNLIAKGFEEVLESREIPYDVIAGTSTSGIPHATTLSDYLVKPMVYVRNKPKGHGLQNQIEGIDADSDLQGKRVVLIEDLISTGGSSANAVQALRDANGECNYCISIFNYGFSEAVDLFESLNPPCEAISLLDYNTLIDFAKKTNYIDDNQAKMFSEWSSDPFGWGEKHGFPKVKI